MAKICQNLDNCEREFLIFVPTLRSISHMIAVKEEVAALEHGAAAERVWSADFVASDQVDHLACWS